MEDSFNSRHFVFASPKGLPTIQTTFLSFKRWEIQKEHAKSRASFCKRHINTSDSILKLFKAARVNDSRQQRMQEIIHQRYANTRSNTFLWNLLDWRYCIRRSHPRSQWKIMAKETAARIHCDSFTIIILYDYHPMWNVVGFEFLS